MSMALQPELGREGLGCPTWSLPHRGGCVLWLRRERSPPPRESPGTAPAPVRLRWCHWRASEGTAVYTAVHCVCSFSAQSPAVQILRARLSTRLAVGHGLGLLCHGGDRGHLTAC